ncbi:hypothetical protein AMELA_G00156090 [Ameiurus melas]|uniref:Uncharacterized protein n=1 Tax=Ameiurus melas TaxID=219545 RepID=A0A7J6AG82_AMEME|nr:hypothetical protein AMELA_G00156090 [Ameiurus melas]
MEQKTTSPQKHMVKSRSKSTEEIPQAKKAFHIPQKSLPGGSDFDQVKEGQEEPEIPTSASEELETYRAQQLPTNKIDIAGREGRLVKRYVVSQTKHLMDLVQVACQRQI